MNNKVAEIYFIREIIIRFSSSAKAEESALSFSCTNAFTVRMLLTSSSAVYTQDTSHPKRSHRHQSTHSTPAAQMIEAMMVL